MTFWVKKTGASKNCQFPCLSPILHFVFLLFLFKKKRTFLSVCSGTESLICFSHWGCPFLPFFQVVWKTLIPVCGSNNVSVPPARRWMVTLSRMSEIQMTSIQGSTELRIIAIAPLWGRSPSYCAFISFHLSAVSSRKAQQRKMYNPTLISDLDPLHIKWLVCNRWMRISRNNNRSIHTLNGSKYAEDGVISGKETEAKERTRQQRETLMLFFKYQQVRECMLINARSILGSAQLP